MPYYSMRLQLMDLKQKHVANSALFNRTKVEDGITLVSLLRTAAEIETLKIGYAVLRER